MTPALDHQDAFGAQVRHLRTERGWSPRDLADHIHITCGYIGEVEQGATFPDRQFADLANKDLRCTGTLTDAWSNEASERRKAQTTGTLLTVSVRDSLRLIMGTDERLDLDEIDEGTRNLAGAYLGSPPGPMLLRGVELRGQLVQRLRTGHYRQNELADLYVMLGRIQGVLAYAALDLGDADRAMVHANAAWNCAEHARDNELRAWVRGTQSLIARFQSNYPQALSLLEDGLRYPTAGTGRLRLLCGIAQCNANLGDSVAANRWLDVAAIEREQLSSNDSVAGLFEFSRAKQYYYAGSSLIWLDGRDDAAGAAREAAQAINMWQQGPPESRSLDDEALAHVYLGTAELRLGELDAAAAALRPILDLPPERQISWIRKRLGRVAAMLRDGPYRGSPGADDLYDEMRSLVS